MSRNTSSRRWTGLIISLLALVLILLIVFILVSQGRSPVDAPSQYSTSSSNDEALSTSEVTSSSPESTLTTSEQELTPAPSGLSLEEAIPLNIIDTQELSLANSFAKSGFELLHLLPDGRLVLLNKSRLAIVDPKDMSEQLIKTAEFGLQAAANDDFIVFGIGGDEVFQIDVYTIATGATVRILDDKNGYFGFELDANNHFYTTKVEALKHGKAIGPYLDIDLISGEQESLVNRPRSLGLNDLTALMPDANLDWSYEIGHAWFEAWRVNTADSFAIELSYMNIYQDQYRYKLYHLDNDRQVVNPVTEELVGNKPQLHSTNGLFVIDWRSFYDGSTKLWYSLEAADSEPTYAVLAMTPDADALYLTKLGPNSQAQGLWQAQVSLATVP